MRDNSATGEAVGVACFLAHWFFSRRLEGMVNGFLLSRERPPPCDSGAGPSGTNTSGRRVSLRDKDIASCCPGHSSGTRRSGPLLDRLDNSVSSSGAGGGDFRFLPFPEGRRGGDTAGGSTKVGSAILSSKRNFDVMVSQLDVAH